MGVHATHNEDAHEKLTFYRQSISHATSEITVRESLGWATNEIDSSGKKWKTESLTRNTEQTPQEIKP